MIAPDPFLLAKVLGEFLSMTQHLMDVFVLLLESFFEAPFFLSKSSDFTRSEEGFGLNNNQRPKGPRDKAEDEANIEEGFFVHGVPFLTTVLRF